MNVYQFIASYTWPIVIVFFLLLFKKTIVELIGTLTKIKFKEWEIEFKINQKLDQFAEIVELAEDKQHQNKDDGHSITGQNNKFKYLKGIKRKSIKKPPNISRELQSNLGELDASIVKLYILTYEKFDESKEMINWSEVIQQIEVPIMIYFLREKNVINDELLSIIIEMREIIPNLVAYMSEEVEQKYVNLCKSLKEHLDGKYIEVAEKTSS